jgi:hypothetical protein
MPNTEHSSFSHLDVILLLVLQPVFFLAFFYLFQLSEHAYFAPIVFVQLLQAPFAVLFILSYLGLGWLFWRKLKWSSIDPTGGMRIFIFSISVVIMWRFATYDYNFYYDQAHNLDRILIILLAGSIYLHPIATPVFTAFAIVVASELHYPLPGASWLWPDKQILFDALILFSTHLVLATFRKTTPHFFLYMVLCLTGGIYFHAALAKLTIGPHFYSWLFADKLSYLFISGYINGWLGFLHSTTIIAIAKYIDRITFPLAAATLLIELSGVFILWSEKVARVVLTGFILLHVGIALASGIFFWMWAAYDIALIIFICKTAPVASRPTFTAKSFVLSVAIIVFANIYFRPIHFAWFDTPFNNRFTLWGVGSSGTVYRFNTRFFSPYNIMFAQSRFYYLSHDPVLVDTYGTTQNYSLARDLTSNDPSQIPKLKHQYAMTFYNARLTEQFATFIRNYVGNAQKRGTKFIAINKLAPPYHFGKFARSGEYNFQEPLREIQVYYEEYFFNGQSILPLRKKSIMTISINHDDKSPP